MLFERGTVVAVEHDSLWLETLKQSSCKQCSAQKGCGQKLVVKSAASKMTCIKAVLLKPQESSYWQVGDVAEIAIDEFALVNATFIAYGMPLIVMLFMTVVANAYGLTDAYVALSAFIGLLLGGAFVRWHSAIHVDNTGYHAKVMRKIISSSSSE